MSKEWICADCECLGTDACYYNVQDGKYPACNRIVVDNDKAYQQGRADAIDEFARPILNGTLHTICRMIASGDIPKDVYQKWLSDTPIGFMTPLEIYAEILKEQLKEQN